MQHKAIGIITARGGSKRIKKKNVFKINGKPLISYTILSARKSKYLEKNVYVSTENKEISNISKQYDAKVIDRPKILASDNTQTLDVLKDAISQLENNGVDFDTVVLLQPTSPLRNAKTIDTAIEKLWKNWKELDVILSVSQTHLPYYWQFKIVKEKLKFIFKNDFTKVRSQDLDKTYEVNGLIYVMKKDFVKVAEGYQFSKNKTGYLITGKIESFEIDVPEDIIIIEALQKTKF